MKPVSNTIHTAIPGISFQTEARPPAAPENNTQQIKPEISNLNYSTVSSSHIPAEGAREFLLNHVTQTLFSEVKLNNDGPNRYTPVLEDQASLEAELSNVVSQAAISSGNNSAVNLASFVDQGFDEAIKILKSTKQLPESLENEFTQIQHSLSDFIARFNALRNNGINPNPVEPKAGNVLEIETRNGEVIKIELASSIDLTQES